MMDKYEMNKKIHDIDNLLWNEDEMLKYIESIEQKQIKVPKDLKEGIKRSINEVKIKRKINYLDILKIVACTLFALIIYEASLSKNIYGMNDKKQIEAEETKIEHTIDKIQDISNNVKDFFMKPLNIKGGK